MRKSACVIFVLLFTTFSYAQSQLCLPPHEGLPHHGGMAPSIDGHVDRIVGYNTDELETGWVRSSLVTYDAGSTVTVANFRGVKDNSANFIYLGFTVQFDQTFDNEDAIVIVLRPNVSSTHNAQERRIDIFPMLAGVGAPPAGVDDMPPGSNASQHIRTNRNPRELNFYRWDTGSSAYVSIPPISNVEVKVRSWSNLATDNNWGVEIKLPTTAVLGGVDWVDINNHFSLYTNILRICNSASCGTIPIQNFASVQFPWPRAVGLTGIISDNINGAHATLAEYEIPPTWLGEAIVGGVPPGDCKGVRFQNGPSSIGTGAALSGLIDAVNPNVFTARVVNDKPANVANDAHNVSVEFRIANWGIGGGPGVWTGIPPTAVNKLSAPATIPSGGASVDVTKGWTLTAAERADYQPGGTKDPHQCVWALLSSPSAVDFTESSVRRNMDFTNLSSHSEDAEISGEGWPDGSPGSDYDFYFTVNERFLTGVGSVTPNTEAQQREELASIVRFPRGANFDLVKVFPDARDFELLTPRERLLIAAEPNRANPLTDWIWVVNGYRRLNATLTLNGQEYPIYDLAGAFGYEGLHRGPIERFRSSLGGRSSPTHTLKVPYGGTTRIDTMIAVDEPGTASSGRWRAFIDAGINFPDGSVDGGFSINAGIERRYNNNWSIEGILGYHRFDGRFEERPFDVDVWQLSANAKYFFGTGPLRPFLNGGVGLYRVDPPDDIEFGMNAGAGLLYELNSKWGLEGVYNYHATDPLNWSTAQLGLRWHF